MLAELRVAQSVRQHSELLMRAIAQHTIGAMLAAAKIDRFRFARLIFDRGKGAALVAAVTERLGGAFPAGAPPVAFAGFYLNGIRGLLSDHGLLVWHITWHFETPSVN
jgi:hypothetical protein